MGKTFLGIICVLGLALCAYLGARTQDGPVKIRLRLVDATTGKNIAGIVRVFSKEGKPMVLPGLYPRMKGLKVSEETAGWHVLPADGGDTTLPREALRLEALSGLESSLTKLDLDLRKNPPEVFIVKLPFVFRPEDYGLVAGNTHLHLMKVTKEDAEKYLQQIPAADRLRVMFISYLERHKDDADYITNRYPIGDLPAFNATGVLFNNGEEHRHNFGGYGEGYGHVMFLGIKDLVKPVSLGPGITGGGVDDNPLRTGIDDARKQGGTIIWCHNSFGFEDVLCALTGRLHALNVFDGSRRGSFEESYYRYLNIGLRMPISTGTDWFIYDFARVYAKVPDKLTIGAWLNALKAGRNQASNGPLLSLKVDGKDIGDVLNLNKPQKVHIEAEAIGRNNFQELQLVHNGKVIQKKASDGKNPFQARLIHEVRIEEPGWFAVRIESTAKNELDQVLFAHSSPIYIDFAGKRVFDVDAAQGLLKQIEEGHAAIKKQGRFSDAQASAKVLALYDEGAKELRERINQRGK